MVFTCLTFCFALWLVAAFGLLTWGAYARNDTMHTLLQILKVKSRGKDTGEAAEWIKHDCITVMSQFYMLYSWLRVLCIFDDSSLRVLSSICILLALVCIEIMLGGICFRRCASKKQVWSGNCFECLNECFAYTSCVQIKCCWL